MNLDNACQELEITTDCVAALRGDRGIMIGAYKKMMNRYFAIFRHFGSVMDTVANSDYDDDALIEAANGTVYTNNTPECNNSISFGS